MAFMKITTERIILRDMAELLLALAIGFRTGFLLVLTAILIKADPKVIFIGKTGALML